jgi:molybdenum cofactor cytidylyltransferase
MKAQAVETLQSTGRVLASAIFCVGGKKLFAKGHILRVSDVHILQMEGMDQIWVAQLEEGEISEDDAVCAVAAEMACGVYEIQMAPGGRANIIATERCCVLIDEDFLRQLNCTSGLVIATVLNFSMAMPGMRIATVKSAPFGVSKSDLEGMINLLRARGSIMQARPVRGGNVAVLYSDLVNGDRARTLFDPVLRQRLERFGVYAHSMLSVLENEEHVARGLQHLLRTKPLFVLIASTTAPAGPDDVVGRAMSTIGCVIERFLAPVEPGNLLLMAYKDDVPLLSAPGCFHSSKPNVLDLIMPPLLAQYRVTTWELACLGHGGLLNQGWFSPGNAAMLQAGSRLPKR